MGIKREINLRSTEARDLREEVTNLQIEKEKMLDQVAKSNDQLEENKRLLIKKRSKAEQLGNQNSLGLKQF